MTEIKSAQPLPGNPAPRPAGGAAELALKLLPQTQTALLPGESAEAEVVSVKESAQAFQLTLRLILANGSQTTIEVSSPKIAVPGSAYLVTALSPNSLLATLHGDSRQPARSLDLELFPVGSVVQGKVIANQPASQAGQTTFQVVLALLDPPLAGRKLALESSRPLPLGSLLTAQVKGSQALSVLPLSGRLEQLGLGQQLTAQQDRQGSLEALFKALQGSPGMTADGLRSAGDKLLGLIPEMHQLGDAQRLAQSLDKSGLFLEARLAAGLGAELKSDMKANLLRLVAQLLPNLPGSTPLASAQAAGTLGQALPAFIRSALGALQADARHQVPGFPLPGKALQAFDGEADLQTLLKLAAAAISRLQTHQLSSLAQTQVSQDGSQLTTWQLELPMRDQGNFVPLQVKLQREESARQGAQEKAETLWRVDLAFDVAPLGPLQVQAQLFQGSLSSQLWAERADTAQLIRTELDYLRQRLVAAGLDVGALECRQGLPPQGPRTSLQQRFVDETA